MSNQGFWGGGGKSDRCFRRRTFGASVHCRLSCRESLFVAAYFQPRWSVLQGEHNGKPIFIRRNDSAAQLKGHAEYGYRVGIAVPLLAPNEKGLPSNDEMETLNKIEDALSNAFENQQASLYVIAITTNAMREFIFYTRVPAEIEAKLNTVRPQFPDHELQFYVASDSKWSGYAQFA